LVRLSTRSRELPPNAGTPDDLSPPAAARPGRYAGPVRHRPGANRALAAGRCTGAVRPAAGPYRGAAPTRRGMRDRGDRQPRRPDPAAVLAHGLQVLPRRLRRAGPV